MEIEKSLTLQTSNRGKYNYSVKVTNTVGSVYSSQIAVTIDPYKPPRITKQPKGGIINSSSGLVLEVVALNPNPAPNNGALSYQWYQNGSPINNPEARKSSWLIKSLNNSGFQSTYYVEVSYKGKITRSNRVTVTFEFKPRSSKWQSLLSPNSDPSLIKIGKIDRSLDLKRSVVEEETVTRGIANEK